MATCPECFTKKPFWAGRCHSCNEHIGFVRQLLAQWVICVVSIGTFLAIIAIFAGGFFTVVLWTIVITLIPLGVYWFFKFVGGVIRS